MTKSTYSVDGCPEDAALMFLAVSGENCWRLPGNGQTFRANAHHEWARLNDWRIYQITRHSIVIILCDIHLCS